MTVKELMEKLQGFLPETELAIENQFGISAIINLNLHEEKVRYLAVDYGGDYHPPESLENHEYSQSREVKDLIILVTDSAT